MVTIWRHFIPTKWIYVNMWWVSVVWTVCAALGARGGAPEYLLPGDVAPHHYDVMALYDIDPATNFSYYGVVNIQLKALSETSKLVLHAQDFSVVEEKVLLEGPKGQIRVSGVKLNETFNLMTLSLDQPLLQGQEYNLTMLFYGNLKQGLDGVYISSYVNKKTTKKEYLIATQFEAISARKAFPCFDEPMYKATFRISLGHSEDFTAVSNMPLKDATRQNLIEEYWPWEQVRKTFLKEHSQFIWDMFDTSVPMSTYLVAYVISKFAFVESPPDLSHTKFRIWARSDAINQTQYASIIGPKVLSHFEEWFNVTFPLPKQDMIAIPDFSAGAMENWGLITYRETALLYDKSQSSFVNKERVAEVIAHELAHQWFGNLVTMKWWSDLWLNEGFATYAASVGVAAVEPTWKADQMYAIENIMSILSLDALESSHPVSAPIEDPKRISEIFDEISYRKGSTLIRMMVMFLGEKVFKEAIHNYLVKHSYQNAEQDDLWAEFTAVSAKYSALGRNLTVKEVMDTWTTQTGYPLLTVTRDYGSNSLSITQKRYLALGAKSPTSSSWWVPLSVVCEGDGAGDARPLQWLARDEGVAAVQRYEHGAAPNRWVLFNTDMIAPYRVNYDTRNWQLLADALRGPRLRDVPPLGRVQLLSDAFELAWTNRLDYSVPLQLASYLQQEQEYLPLETGLHGLSKIENVLKRSADFGAFQKYVRKIITNTYKKAGGLSVKKIINGDDLNSVKMQLLTSSWACRMKVPGCEENAIQLFQSWMETEDPDVNNPIPLDLRRTVYCTGVARGSVAAWRFVLSRRRNTNVAAASDALLYALTCTREVWILNQYLEWTVTENSEVRTQDAASVIVGVLRSTVGYYVAKEFVYSRIQDIYRAFNNQGRRLGYIVKTMVNQFTTERELEEFLKWRDANANYLTEATLGVQQAIEKARVNIDWITKNRQSVVEKLREYSLDEESEELKMYRNDATPTSPNFLLIIVFFLYIYNIHKRDL